MPLPTTLDSRQERLLILALAGVQFCHIVDFMVLMPLGPQLMRQLHINTSQFGLLVSAYTFAAGLSGFASAFVTDHIDRRRMLLTLFTGFALATLACGFANSYAMLMAARIAAGACGGILGATVLALIGDCIPDSRRGFATGKIMASFSVAAVAGVPLGLFLANSFGSWHAPFIFVACVASALWLLAFRAVPSVPARQHGDYELLRTFKAVFSVGNHWLSFALIAALMLAGFSVIPFLSPYMVHNVGLRETQLPLLYLCGGIATFFTAPAIGKLADKIGKARTLRLVALTSILPLFLVTHLPPLPLPVVLATTTFFMIFVTGRLIPAMAIITASCTPALRGRFLGFNTALQQLAASLASLWPTWVLTTNASGQLVNYAWVGYGAISMTVAAMWLAGRIKTVS